MLVLLSRFLSCSACYCVWKKDSKSQVLVCANSRINNFLKMGSNCKRQGESLNWDADLTSLKKGKRRKEERKERRVGNFILQCSPKTIWQSWWGILTPSLPIQGVPCLIGLPEHSCHAQSLVGSVSWEVWCWCVHSDRLRPQQLGPSTRQDASHRRRCEGWIFVASTLPPLTLNLWRF